jgi:indole-3-glycerol phosphate synthase
LDILEKIIQRKRGVVESAKHLQPIDDLRLEALRYRHDRESNRLRQALQRTGSLNIIAEFKRCSPSKGVIRQDADASDIARAYDSAGAAAISVLTEEYYFQGCLDDLRLARKAVSLPLLRKDFIFDAYQVYESAAAGADALLLIVASLNEQLLCELLQLTENQLGMDALVEVHNAAEMETAVAAGARLIGVNNRDLRTFAVTTQTSIELAPLAPPEVVLVSESGLMKTEVARLHAFGYHGFLIGEALMRAEDPAAELRNFLAAEAAV